MNNNILQAAFAIYHNPGVYALLLGSGVSRAAEILTGEQIIKDLIEQIAAAMGEASPENPFEWYQEHFNKEPGYDVLLEALGQTPLDRSAILRSYFEPTDEDLEQGRKTPTKAHEAIAHLVKDGYIKVIVTTNFDRLLETALREAGVEPDVIITEDTLDDIPPLQHARVAIIKLHGDYKSRTRNIGEELTSYPDKINQLLDRIFSEYGLVICGWSAEWDVALRQAVERSQQNRYGLYWIAYEETPKEAAQSLIDLRFGTLINNINADRFFVELDEMIQSLSKISERQAPLTPTLISERVKKYIINNQHIELEDLIVGEAAKALNRFRSEDFDKQRKQSLQKSNHGISFEIYENIVKLYFAELENTLSAINTLCWYSETAHILAIVRQIFELWSEYANYRSYLWNHLPYLFVVYSSGIIAIRRGRWDYLYLILVDLQIEVEEPVSKDNILNVIFRLLWRTQQNFLDNDIDAKDIFEPLLNPLLERYFTVSQFQQSMDLLDTIVSLTTQSNNFVRPEYRTRSWKYIQEFWETGGKENINWEVLKAGFFEGDPKILLEKLEQYHQKADRYWEYDVLIPSPNYFEAYK